MFDFIKNDRGDEIKGFQWFIDNYGPEDEEESLLTVDLLWDFFYEKGKDHLAPQIRTILDVYSRIDSYNLNKKQNRLAFPQKEREAIFLFFYIFISVFSFVSLILFHNVQKISRFFRR